MKRELITIKGAGISGLTAAINLAKQGFPVTVFEKNQDVGLRHSGDFEGLENWSDKEDTLYLLKKWNIEINSDFTPIYEIQLIFENKAYQIKDKKPFVYLVKRGREGSLDFALKEQAVKHGVEIKFGETIERAKIVATGPQKARVFAYGSLFKTDFPGIKIITFVDQNMAPESYAYALFWNGQATVAAVLFPKDIKDREKYLGNTLTALKNTAGYKLEKIKDFSGFGDFRIPQTAIYKNSLLVGEVAGFQDALFFFGMKYAFQSGFLAAKAISENKDYDQLWKETFLPKMKTSLINRWGFSNRILRNAVLKHNLKKDKKEEYVNIGYKLYNFPTWCKLIYPYARLRYRHLL